jgi:hypothetical protein
VDACYLLVCKVLSSLLEALWRINRIEMERTVGLACKRVLRDPTR